MFLGRKRSCRPINGLGRELLVGGRGPAYQFASTPRQMFIYSPAGFGGHSYGEGGEAKAETKRTQFQCNVVVSVVSAGVETCCP